MTADLNHYTLFGLRIASEIPLPELFEAPSGHTVDVLIRRGVIDAPDRDVPGLAAHQSGALLVVPGTGRYWMRGGVDMVVEAHPGGSERNLRLYLLGSALAAILHQRSLLPLHANAVEIEGKAVAFMGHSGAGKSTLAAWFHDRGFRLLADDVCVVTFDAAGQPYASPGIPRLRLWGEAIEASGRSAEDYQRSFEHYDDYDKYDVPLPNAAAMPDALPLARIYSLEKASGAEGAFRELKGIDAVQALAANTYRGSFLKIVGGAERHWRLCMQLVPKVELFAAERIWGFEAFQEQALRLEEHAR